MEVEVVAISSLTLDPKNARRHDEGVPELAASLEEFGQRKNIDVWHDVVMAGNGLVQAALSLDWKDIAIHRLPEDWTYEQAQAFALADNKTAELSSWDSVVLDEIRFDLDANGWDMEKFGFEPLILGPLGDKDPDDVPEVPDAPKAQLGDLYQLGEHRLLCGDATDAAQVARVMGGGLADCLWTDPPYGVDYVGKTKDSLTIRNDTKGGLLGLLSGAFAVAGKVLAPGSPFYIAAPAGPRCMEFLTALQETGLQLHEMLVWVKNTMVLGHSDYHFRHELVLYGWTAGEGRSGRGKHQGTKWYGGNAQTSVLEYDKPLRSESHPTMKPIGLVEQCLLNSTRAGEVVLDSFGGSGSTLVACETSGRKARLVEIDPRYVDVTLLRWEELTGQKAKKLR